MALIQMPALSPTMTEGKLARWLVNQGDSVHAGDVIAEIETDKAVMEVEALDDGVISSIMIAEGTEAVAVGTVIAEILGDGEASSLGENAVAETETQPAASATVTAPAATEPVVSASPRIPVVLNSAAAAAETASSGTRLFASPLARRLAAERGIDLGKIRGSGPHGRIIKADIEAVPFTTADNLASTPSQPWSAAAQPLSSLEDNSPMRMIIAERLQQSKREAPHFYLNMDIEIDALLALRKQINESLDDNTKISVNDLLIRGAALTMKQVPAANSSWEGSQTRRWHHADIAVAVAVEGGLLTPVVRQAETKSVRQISTEMADLASRARAGKLAPEDYADGSFTISNLGMYGITSFSAVINPPQGAILAIGAGEQRPVVREGAVTVATMMTVTLSCDHRVVDGAVGATWLAAFKAVLEQPIRLLV